MYQNKKVLIVDDDQNFRLEVCQYLVTKEYRVYPVDNMEAFKNHLDRFLPDVALIDKNLNFEDGFELIQHIRNHPKLSHLPVIVVTGDPNIDSRMEAFKLGADDIMMKPFAMEELNMRIQASIRRSGSYQVAEQTLEFADIRVNMRSQEVFFKEEKTKLTNIEYKLLLEFLSKRGEVLFRNHLVNKVLTVNNNNPRTLDVHINSLRKKLGGIADHIKTVRGRGYIFTPGAEL